MRFSLLRAGALLLLTSSSWLHAGETLDNQLASLADNSWLKIEPRPSQRLVLQERHEHSPVTTITSRQPKFREYTSPIWGDGKIYYFGGGHGGYQGNDMEIFDPTENSWRQCYRPVCPPKDDSTYYSGGSERSYVDPESGAGQPYVLHGYARCGYDAGLHQYMCTAMFPTEVQRDASTGTWQLVRQAFSFIGFEEQTNRWQRLADVPGELQPGPTSLSYDPDLGGMVAFSERGGYLQQAGHWKKLGDSDVQLAASGGTAALYLPQLKAHLLAILGHGGAKETGVLALFRPADERGKVGPTLPLALAARVGPGTGGFNLAMVYDSMNHRVLFMTADDANRPEVWSYDPAADAWERNGVADSAPKLPGVFEPGRGRAPLLYDPARNVVFAVLRSGEEAELWAYRFRKMKSP